MRQQRRLSYRLTLPNGLAFMSAPPAPTPKASTDKDALILAYIDALQDVSAGKPNAKTECNKLWAMLNDDGDPDGPPMPTEDLAETQTAATLSSLPACVTYLAMLDGSVWQRYQGARGGKGWKNTTTGRIVYTEAMPGTRGAKKVDVESGEKPTANPKKSEVQPSPAKKPTAAEIKDRSAKALAIGAKISAHHQGKGDAPTDQDYRDLVDHLPTLTIPKLKELKGQLMASFGKGAKLKAQMAEALRAHIQGKIGVGSKNTQVEQKTDSSPQGSQAKGINHPVAKKIMAGLDNPNLSPEQKKSYGEAMTRVLSAMPKAAHDAIDRNLDKTNFYEDVKGVGIGTLDDTIEQARRDGKPQDTIDIFQGWKKQIENGEMQPGGAYVPESKQMHIDGDYKFDFDMPGRYSSGNGSLAHEVYAHELGHAIDGPNLEISGSKEWQEAYEEEIQHGGIVVRDGQFVQDTPKLSEYGGSKPSEGLAEFCRLLYGSDVPTAKIAEDFPKATEVMKKRGLWPAERAGKADKMQEVFDERLPLNDDGSHIDTLKKQQVAAKKKKKG